MAKSKKTTILILCIILIYFLFSQFYLNTLGNTYVYVINPLFFILMAIALKFTIPGGYNKDRYKKKMLHYAIIAALLYVFVNMLSGLVFSFGKNPYSTDFKGLVLNSYSMIFVLVLREYIRCKLINNVYKKDRRLIYVLIIIIFSLQEISIKTICENFNVYYVFKYIFTIIIPAVTRNYLFTYIGQYAGCIPAIAYEVILYVLKLTSPILPNAQWVFYAVLDIVIPLILLIYCMYEISLTDKEHIRKRERTIEPKGIIPWAIIIIITVWFALGIFPIKPVGIVTGSMEPQYNIGDVVIIEKCTADSIKIGDVIEYKRKNYTVVHRVVDKYEEEGRIFFITKGDNNDDNDAEAVSQEQIQGRVIAKIPYLAMPKIWINGLKEDKSNVDIELGK